MYEYYEDDITFVAINFWTPGVKLCFI
jgi:hypothetical protein